MSRPPLRRAAAFAALGLLLSCGGKETITEPSLRLGAVEIVGNLVRWSTDEAVRASVRYGGASGDYDAMAYPAAESRADRAFARQHQVPLLGVEQGSAVYYQLVHEFDNGALLFDEERSFVPTVDGPDELFSSTMVHIGWGDAHVLRFPTTGAVMLFDAGSPDAASAVGEYLVSEGIASVDVMLATHIHFDHIGGLVGDEGEDGLLETFEPGVFIDSPTKSYSRRAYDDARAIVLQRDIERVVVVRGQTEEDVPALALDPAVDILVLNSSRAPDVPLKGFSGDDINNESIVMKFSYGDVDFILGGDAEVEAEGSIRAAFSASELNVEYYKAHHHGRHDGSTNAFLNVLQPRVSLFPVSWHEYSPSGSCGDSRGCYEAETNPTLGRVRAAGSHWYVVDDLWFLGIPYENGARYNVSFVTDGISYEVRAKVATQVVKHEPVTHRVPTGESP